VIASLGVLFCARSIDDPDAVTYQENSMSTFILRKPAVQERTGLSESTIARMVKRGDFPAPVQISSRTVGWKSDLVDEWINSRPSSTGNAQA
jgi:prophage regulatory protein